MIPVREVAGQKVAVLGMGRSGRATARALVAGEAEVICWDDEPEARVSAGGQGFRVDSLAGDEMWTDIECLVVSPGVPHLYPEPHPLVKMAWRHGVPVDNDVGLFFRNWNSAGIDDAGIDDAEFGDSEFGDFGEYGVVPYFVCVTGSNGKSTTAALIGHLLDSAGQKVQVGGNIGRPVLDLEPVSDGEFVILELSSYQIELAQTLTPDIAVFVNFSPDHLDRHGGVGGYFAAKRRLFSEGAPERQVIGVDEMEGEYLAARADDDLLEVDSLVRISARRSIEGDDWSVSVKNGFLVERRRGRQVASVDLRDIRNLRGTHNWQNACAAFAVCRSSGLAPRLLPRGLASFPGLPHRCQVVGEHGGVSFVNDSKATNADAAARALSMYRNIRWIAGGRAKEGGIASISGGLDNVRKVYLVGEAAELFRRQLGGRNLVISGTIDEAVKSAAAEAEPGDVVLLSPAAASFDQFTDFEARGDAFVEAVKNVMQGDPAKHP